MTKILIDERIVKFLKGAIPKESELYNESIFNLFSVVYYSILDSEDYSEELRRVLQNYILSVYSKFYDRLGHYLDSFCSDVIKERYGLNKEGKSKTYKEISKTLGMDLNKVIRREKYSLEKLAELNKCVEVEGRVFDKEEYEQYKLDTEGATLLKAILKSNLNLDDKYYSKSVIVLFSDVCLVDLSDNQYRSYLEYDGVDYNVTKVYRKFYDRLDYYLKSLVYRDRLILEWRYGLKLERGLTYNEIGKMLGMTGSSASSSLYKSINKLKSICVYYKVDGEFLDSEEFAEYEQDKALKEIGNDYERAEKVSLKGIIKESTVVRSLSLYGVYDMVQLRGYVFSNIKHDSITEQDIVKLFCTLYGVGPLKAKSAVESIKRAGFLDFLMDRKD